MNLQNARKHLQAFEFTRLFVEELGWSHPSSAKPIPMAVKGASFTRRGIAELSDVVVMEIVAENDAVPDAAQRAAIHKEIAKLHHENVLIFVDSQRSQSLWYWVKRQNGAISPRSHIFVHGQPGDLLLSKLAAMAMDFSDFDDDGRVPLIEVTDRLKQALDIEKVTKKFYGEFQEQHLAFLELIGGIADERDRRWYASVLLNRLMFIYFLQRKFFLDGGDERYLQNKLAQSRQKGGNLYYSRFLKALFFEGFAKPEDARSDEVNALLGKIKYLNGGLFLPHPIEERWPKISVPDKAFENLFALFERYSWNLNDTSGGEDNEINPDVLGYIFEKYINQKAFGAYYTRPEITEYLCERTIHRLILDGVAGGAGKAAHHFESVGDLLLALDAPLCKKLLHEVLPSLRLLDPACGSAAFLVSAMKTLINVYSAVIGKIGFLGDRGLQDWLKKTQKEHKSVSYFIKRSIITNNLFGVDLMDEAIEIAKLRLFLALVASANAAEDLEPLPNIEFNVMAGNSLIGLLHVDPEKFNALTGGAGEQKRMTMVREPAPGELGFSVQSTVAKTRKEREAEYLAQVHGRQFADLLEEKNNLIEVYRRATSYGDDLQELRDGIAAKKAAANATISRLMVDQFRSLGIQYEEATWDENKGREGKPRKRAVRETDLEALKPFHWGYEFDKILGEKGGFDAIITNPPWEIFKPNSKEFFEEFSDLVTKKKMTIHEFEKEQAKLLRDPELRRAWLEYLSGYPHISAYYRSAPQYKNQISIVNGRRAGADINLYKLFTEQCYNLLRKGGVCGIVLPSGIYTDLGAKQLRELLFTQTEVTGLFCFENRKEIFEGVDSRFKFLVLTFEKGGATESFPAAFMRHDVAELDRFPQEGAIEIVVPLIRRLSPDSLSVMEFKTSLDVTIAKKMCNFTLLGESIADKWNLVLGNEFHMTNDSSLFKTDPAKGRLPLYEGKMIWQFDHRHGEAKYWIDEKEARQVLIGARIKDTGQTLDYEGYRFAFREIASNTNERGLIATILPKRIFANHKLMLSTSRGKISSLELLFCCAVTNSFAFDYLVRQRTTTTVSMFTFYQLPVPRLTAADGAFGPVVARAARLICTTAEFDELAKAVGLKSHRDGATESVERARLRAELDGLIAHLYGLTEQEFAYILTTFPLVPEPVKVAARNAYRDVLKGLIR